MYRSSLLPCRRTLVYVYNKFFCMLSSFHFQSHNPKYLNKVWLLSRSVFKNGGSRCCLKVESKEKKFLLRFTNQADKWSAHYSFLKQLTRGKSYALCKTCNTNFSIGHGGNNDVKKHLELKKHVEYVKTLKLSHKMTSFLSSENTSALDGNVVKAELLCTGFIRGHNLPISTADHAGKLLKAMFPDSKIAK